MSVVLALDVARATGICWGEPGDVPRFASQQFQKAGEGGSMDGVANATGRAIVWLIDFLKAEHVDLAAIEAPIPERALGRHSNAWATAMKYALIGAMSGVLKAKSIPVSFANIQAVRKSFLGHGNLSGEIAKPEAMRVCKAAGWSPSTYDESDAGAVWHFVCLHQFPRLTQLVDPISLGIIPLQKPARSKQPKLRGETIRIAPKNFKRAIP